MKKFTILALFLVLLLSLRGAFAQDAGTLEKGVEFYNAGDYKQAIETLEKVTETDKNNRKAWLYLGMSQAKSQNKTAAVKAFKAVDKISFKQANDTETETSIKFISKPHAGYTESARGNGIQGRVKLAVEFGADGTIKEIFPFEKLQFGLTENSIKAAQGIKFNPAVKNGKPVSTITIVSYSFAIY